MTKFHAPVIASQHMVVMEDMLKDFILGEHLLLIGNQGVGKNKIADRFLSLLNRPREYLQLHRSVCPLYCPFYYPPDTLLNV